MSKMPTKIIFEPSTNTISVNGVKGKNCAELTKELEKALGEVEKTTKTNEYYEKQPINTISAKG